MAVALSELNLPPCEHCQQNPATMKENGCQEDSPIPDRWQIGKYFFQRCPKTLVTPLSVECIRAYNWMKRKYLPGNLSWDEQTVKFNEAISIIEFEVARIEKEEIERNRRNNHL